MKVPREFSCNLRLISGARNDDNLRNLDLGDGG